MKKLGKKLGVVIVTFLLLITELTLFSVMGLSLLVRKDNLEILIKNIIVENVNSKDYDEFIDSDAFNDFFSSYIESSIDYTINGKNIEINDLKTKLYEVIEENCPDADFSKKELKKELSAFIDDTTKEIDKIKKSENSAITTLTYVLSTKFKVLISLALIGLIIFLYLLQHEKLAWIRTLSVCTIITSVQTSLLGILTKSIVIKTLESESSEIKPLLDMVEKNMIIVSIVGIMVSGLLLIVRKIINSKKEEKLVV